MIWLLGWNVLISKERLNKKSVIVVAPHTSFIDGVIGWLALNAVGIKYRCISAEWLFFFPMKYIMRGMLNAIPCGKKSGNSITVACKALEAEDDMHVVICPEGRLSAVDKWSGGFFIIAKNAKCHTTRIRKSRCVALWTNCLLNNSAEKMEWKLCGRHIKILVDMLNIQISSFFLN